MEKEQLFYKRANCYDSMDSTAKTQMTAFAKKYMEFLTKCKTERDCVKFAKRQAESAGFVPFEDGMKLHAGDKVYFINRSKSIILAVIGQKPLVEGVSIVGAHIDSPRLDLKPMPVYEDGGMCLLKTHYYGGIKKYQWTSIPLELRGVVVTADGKTIEVSVGADKDDPIFTVTDLLPHLAKDQMKKSLSEGVEGENLNVLAGSFGVSKEKCEKDRIKFAVLSILNEKYGITEEDFMSAELTFVPAYQAREIGFDRSLIGAYGHDDKVCAYAALQAELSVEMPEYTAVCILADKEETGSDGVTGMRSEAFERFIAGMCDAAGAKLYKCFEKSICMSADVTNAFDPTYASVSDKKNNAMIGSGLCINKYTGARGKSDTSDASAEVVGRIRAILKNADVCFQIGDLGKVDMGGGGTIAKYFANRNIDVIDAGVPVLSMHSPLEVISKADLFESYRGYRAFIERKS